jgi:hypothetical protein
MGTSDDEEIPDEVVLKTPVQRPTQYPVSPGARDLINFLAEGPPDIPEEPVSAGRSTVSQDAPKKGGRLQRMISKLTLKDADQRQSRSNSRSADSYSKSSRRTQSNVGSSVTQSPSGSPLYNKPIPPRPPPIPTSPPTTPSQSSTSLVEPIPPSPRGFRTPNTRRSVPSSWDPGSVTPESSRPPITVSKGGQESSPVRVTPPSPKPPFVNGQAKGSQAKSHQAKEEDKLRTNITRVSKQSPSSVNGSGTKVLLSPPERQSSKKSSDTARKSLDSDQSPAMAAFIEHAQEMRRLLAQATNVDECRLIVDMFMAKSRIQLEPVDHSKPFPPSNASQPLPLRFDADLEHSLVELFLGGVGEGGESDGNEQPLSPANDAISGKGSVALPMSPPDTPQSDHGDDSTSEPVVVKDTLVATPVTVAAAT